MSYEYTSDMNKCIRHKYKVIVAN